MDRLSFVFSLLLIVSVTTTFGSVIKAKNPTEEKIEALQSDAGLDHYPEMVFNLQELEALLKASHGPKSMRDQDSEMLKFEADSDSADVIPGHELTNQKLQELLSDLPSATRKVAIGIDNESNHGWKEPSTYIYSGTVKGELPYYLDDGKAVLYGALSTKEEVEANGVLAYYIQDFHKTLAVMWYDPYKRHNTWNSRLYDGEREADSTMFKDLRDNGALDKTGNVDLGSGLIASGDISSPTDSLITLKIVVQKAELAN